MIKSIRTVDDNEPTAEEVEAMVAEQMQNLPDWWNGRQPEPRESGPEPFLLHDDKTGVTTYAVPCWHCGKHQSVDQQTFEAGCQVTCEKCAREIKQIGAKTTASLERRPV